MSSLLPSFCFYLLLFFCCPLSRSSLTRLVSRLGLLRFYSLCSSSFSSTPFVSFCSSFWLLLLRLSRLVGSLLTMGCLGCLWIAFGLPLSSLLLLWCSPLFPRCSATFCFSVFCIPVIHHCWLRCLSSIPSALSIFAIPMFAKNCEGLFSSEVMLACWPHLFRLIPR